jgi:hypothetical protein
MAKVIRKKEKGATIVFKTKVEAFSSWSGCTLSCDDVSEGRVLLKAGDSRRQIMMSLSEKDFEMLVEQVRLAKYRPT